MKYALALCALFSASALAENVDQQVCQKYFSCGTFRTHQQQDQSRLTDTTITITATGANTADFSFVNKGTTPEQRWDLQAEFGPRDGHFTLKSRRTPDRIFATGLCVDKLCTFAMRPFLSQDNEVVGNSGHIRFTGDQLEYFLLHSTPNKNFDSKTIFTKQP